MVSPLYNHIWFVLWFPSRPLGGSGLQPGVPTLSGFDHSVNTSVPSFTLSAFHEHRRGLITRGGLVLVVFIASRFVGLKIFFWWLLV